MSTDNEPSDANKAMGLTTQAKQDVQATGRAIGPSWGELLDLSKEVEQEHQDKIISTVAAEDLAAKAKVKAKAKAGASRVSMTGGVSMTGTIAMIGAPVNQKAAKAGARRASRDSSAQGSSIRVVLRSAQDEANTRAKTILEPSKVQRESMNSTAPGGGEMRKEREEEDTTETMSSSADSNNASTNNQQENQAIKTSVVVGEGIYNATAAPVVAELAPRQDDMKEILRIGIAAQLSKEVADQLEAEKQKQVIVEAGKVKERRERTICGITRSKTCWIIYIIILLVVVIVTVVGATVAVASDVRGSDNGSSGDRTTIAGIGGDGTIPTNAQVQLEQQPSEPPIQKSAVPVVSNTTNAPSMLEDVVTAPSTQAPTLAPITPSPAQVIFPVPTIAPTPIPRQTFRVRGRKE